MGFMLQSQGQYSKLCTCGNNGSDSALETDMPAILAQGQRLLGEMYIQTMEKLGWIPNQISKVCMSPSRIKGFKLHAEYAKVPIKIMPDTVSALGSIVTATIPVNLHKLMTEKMVSNGDKIFLSGVGSGIALSQVGLIWDAA